MDRFSSINRWWSDRIGQLVVPASVVSLVGTEVHLRSCLGQTVVVPRDLVDMETTSGTSGDASGAATRHVDQSSVTLKLAEWVDEADAEFLGRLISVALQLGPHVVASPPDRKSREREGMVAVTPVSFVVPAGSVVESKQPGNYEVNLSGLLNVQIPASLVDVEAIAGNPQGKLGVEPGGHQLTFKPSSKLTPVLNQLVHLINELLHGS